MTRPMPAWIRDAQYASPEASWREAQRRRRRWRALERGARTLIGAGWLGVGLVVLSVAGAVWGVSAALRDFFRGR